MIFSNYMHTLASRAGRLLCFRELDLLSARFARDRDSNRCPTQPERDTLGETLLETRPRLCPCRNTHKPSILATSDSDTISTPARFPNILQHRPLSLQPIKNFPPLLTASLGANISATIMAHANFRTMLTILALSAAPMLAFPVVARSNNDNRVPSYAATFQDVADFVSSSSVLEGAGVSA